MDASDFPSRRMLGYMLAHEQFTVPQLATIGSRAAEAGFGLLEEVIASWREITEAVRELLEAPGAKS
jgi:hypothetical protein